MEDEDADVSTWLPADPHHPMYTPFAEEETWDDSMDRTLVVAALAELAEHRLDNDPTVLEALETVPCGSYRTGWRTFVDLCQEDRGLRLRVGSVEEYDSADGAHAVEWRVGTKAHRQGAPAETARQGGVLCRTRWCLHGLEHRVGGPSFSRAGAGYEAVESWRQKGVRGRSDGPCRMEWTARGTLCMAVCAPSAGGVARGPAVVRWWRPEGGERWVTYYEDGVGHRRGGPASTRYSDDGSIQSEEWALDGLMSRADGPAGRYYRGGVLVGEGYWIRGWLWRSGGPAFWFDETDGCRHEVWTTRRSPSGRVHAEYRTVGGDGHTTVHTDGPVFEALPDWDWWMPAPAPDWLASVGTWADDIAP